MSIIDIKQITNKLSAEKILKLINEELEIINHYEMNPTKIKEKADKLLLNQWSDQQLIDDTEQTFISRRERNKLSPNQVKLIA